MDEKKPDPEQKYGTIDSTPQKCGTVDSTPNVSISIGEEVAESKYDVKKSESKYGSGYVEEEDARLARALALAESNDHIRTGRSGLYGRNHSVAGRFTNTTCCWTFTTLIAWTAMMIFLITRECWSSKANTKECIILWSIFAFFGVMLISACYCHLYGPFWSRMYCMMYCPNFVLTWIEADKHGPDIPCCPKRCPSYYTNHPTFNHSHTNHLHSNLWTVIADAAGAKAAT